MVYVRIGCYHVQFKLIHLVCDSNSKYFNVLLTLRSLSFESNSVCIFVSHSVCYDDCYIFSVWPVAAPGENLCPHQTETFRYVGLPSEVLNVVDGSVHIGICVMFVKSELNLSSGAKLN